MNIRRIQQQDTAQVLAMMQEFYRSEAVHTNGSDEIFRTDIAQCVNGSPYLEGYVFEENSEILGYAMLARSFSTEFGKPCIWLEDLYLRENARGRGAGGAFLRFLRETYPDAVHRLEVEAENTRAVEIYRKHGFGFLPYQEMFR